MPFYSAVIGKKTFILSAETIAKAEEVLSFHFKDKTIKITEIDLSAQINFRAGLMCASNKIKDSVIYFTTSNGITGKVDISLLPIELV